MSAALISRGSDTNLTGDARLHDSSAPLWNREADSSVEGTQSKVGDGFVLDPAVVRGKYLVQVKSLSELSFKQNYPRVARSFQ